MDRNKKKIIENFFYTSFSSILSLLLSFIIIIIIPKLIGVEEFGYWQLYIFYSAYVGFLHFGWSDGIYLKYGGDTYKSLNKNLLYSQFYMFIAFQLVLSIIIILLINFLISDNLKLVILYFTIINMLITNVRSIPLFILQATNRIKEYAKIVLSGQFSYFTLLIFLLVAGYIDFKTLIVADLIGRLISLIYATYLCRDLLINSFSSFSFKYYKEAFENIQIGIKVMFAYISSLLIIGVVRFGIEFVWDVKTFGKVSLVLNISKLVMLFINAFGIVIFPLLRRAKIEDLPNIYDKLRDLLMPILLGFLVFYYPLKIILSIWLPDYAQSLEYMAFLLPIVVFEGKTALLTNIYLKTLRKEKLMLQINALTLGISVLITLITTIILGNLDYAILSIVFLLAIRSIISEVILSNYLKLNVFKDITLEVLMVSLFIVLFWNLGSLSALITYVLAFTIYIFTKIKKIYLALSFFEIFPNKIRKKLSNR